MTTFLETNEVVALTNKVRYRAQSKALKSMGIEHRIRPDGSVAILRAHIHKAFDGDTTATPSSSRRNIKTTSPNWGAL